MQRRKFLFLASTAIAVPGWAVAGPVEDQIVALLSEQGYTTIKMSRTLLGRRRIVAIGAERRREIIFNPRTGEILRDFWEEIGSDGSSESGLFDDDDDGKDDDDEESGDEESGGSGSDDDDDDEDDDEDNSGPGGGDDDDEEDEEDKKTTMRKTKKKTSRTNRMSPTTD